MLAAATVLLQATPFETVTLTVGGLRTSKGEGEEEESTPRQNAMRMTTKFNIRSAFYFRSSI